MVRREILRQVNSPHETLRFPQCLRAFFDNLKKVEEKYCRKPTVGFYSSHRRQSSRRRNDKNTMNEKIPSYQFTKQQKLARVAEAVFNCPIRGNGLSQIESAQVAQQILTKVYWDLHDAMTRVNDPHQIAGSVICG